MAVTVCVSVVLTAVGVPVISPLLVLKDSPLGNAGLSEYTI